MDIKNLRVDYNKNRIDFNNILKDPIDYFNLWFKEALQTEINEANSCVLSTVDCLNNPNSRVVLLKYIEENSFIFFTNYDSAKSRDILKNNNVALNFYWGTLERQVRINGCAERISELNSDQYFNERPKKSQISTLISKQSSNINLNCDLNLEMKQIEEKYKGKTIKRPSNWGGFKVIPKRIEFWQGRPSRLHDRLVYTFDQNWAVKRLAP